jgi:predicted nucleic acid-binding protein
MTAAKVTLHAAPEKSFVDTNILVYANDRSSGAKHRIAGDLLESLWNTGTGVVSTQVLQEFCVSARKHTSKPMPVEEIASLVRDYQSWEIVVNTAESVVDALDLEARYQISFWDALILQAAERADAKILYSEDLSHGQLYDTVRSVNPFIG